MPGVTDGTQTIRQWLSLGLLFDALDKIWVLLKSVVMSYDEPETHMSDSDVPFSSQVVTYELQSVICGFA